MTDFLNMSNYSTIGKAILQLTIRMDEIISFCNHALSSAYPRVSYSISTRRKRMERNHGVTQMPQQHHQIAENQNYVVFLQRRGFADLDKGVQDPIQILV